MGHADSRLRARQARADARGLRRRAVRRARCDLGGRDRRADRRAGAALRRAARARRRADRGRARRASGWRRSRTRRTGRGACPRTCPTGPSTWSSPARSSTTSTSARWRRRSRWTGAARSPPAGALVAVHWPGAARRPRAPATPCGPRALAARRGAARRATTGRRRLPARRARAMSDDLRPARRRRRPGRPRRRDGLPRRRRRAAASCCSPARAARPTSARRCPRSCCAASWSPTRCRSPTEPAGYDEHGITLRPASRDRAAIPTRARSALDDGGEHRLQPCVLATGAEPVRPPIPGARRLPGVHLLRTVADALALRAARRAGHARASSSARASSAARRRRRCARRGCAVTLVSQERAPQAARLGDAVAERARRLARRRRASTRATTHDDRGDRARRPTMLVRRRSTAPRSTPTSCCSPAASRRAPSSPRAAGLASPTTAARSAPTPRCAPRAPGVLACGDCCRAEHAVAGRPLHVEHWGDALAQGEVAGWTAAGERRGVGRPCPASGRRSATRTLKYAAWGDGFDDRRGSSTTTTARSPPGTGTRRRAASACWPTTTTPTTTRGRG